MIAAKIFAVFSFLLRKKITGDHRRMSCRAIHQNLDNFHSPSANGPRAPELIFVRISLSFNYVSSLPIARYTLLGTPYSDIIQRTGWARTI
jgi:hypothetical protein